MSETNEDKNNKDDVACYKCEKNLTLSASQKITRHEECEYCFASLRCCKMCHFYDISSYNDCKEPMANRIIEKEKANFCDYYKLKGLGEASASKEALTNAAHALFKD
jgi:hypothetical protein